MLCHPIAPQLRTNPNTMCTEIKDNIDRSEDPTLLPSTLYLRTTCLIRSSLKTNTLLLLPLRCIRFHRKTDERMLQELVTFTPRATTRVPTNQLHNTIFKNNNNNNSSKRELSTPLLLKTNNRSTLSSTDDSKQVTCLNQYHNSQKTPDELRCRFSRRT